MAYFSFKCLCKLQTLGNYGRTVTPTAVTLRAGNRNILFLQYPDGMQTFVSMTVYRTMTRRRHQVVYCVPRDATTLQVLVCRWSLTCSSVTPILLDEESCCHCCAAHPCSSKEIKRSFSYAWQFNMSRLSPDLTGWHSTTASIILLLPIQESPVVLPVFELKIPPKTTQ